ncbi:hypothetical protein ACFSR7_06045 [Cohnella sp. GCM10020058]|uniref:hypothetical protein n=1 Tax=Cohnella sp. GCM10020058 TaxID=3317330 RepID=UPI00363918BA
MQPSISFYVRSAGVALKEQLQQQAPVGGRVIRICSDRGPGVDDVATGAALEELQL